MGYLSMSYFYIPLIEVTENELSITVTEEYPAITDDIGITTEKEIMTTEEAPDITTTEKEVITTEEAPEITTTEKEMMTTDEDNEIITTQSDIEGIYMYIY